jgi:hypothetical protein
MDTNVRTAWLILIDLPTHMTQPHPSYEPEYDTFVIPAELKLDAVKALAAEGLLIVQSQSTQIITINYRDSNADMLSVCLDYEENSVSIHYL